MLGQFTQWAILLKARKTVDNRCTLGRYQHRLPFFHKKSIVYYCIKLFILMNKKDLENDINEGLSSYQIAKKYKKSQGSISYQLKKYGLKTKLKSIGNGNFSPNKNRYDKCGSSYNNVNWIECQKLHDLGLTWSDLIKKGFPHNGMSWAVKNGKLKMRTISESQKLAWKCGKQNPEIYRTNEHRKKMSKFGGYREKAGRIKGKWYVDEYGNKYWLQGSWEWRLADFLNSKNIKWEKNKIGYKYLYENKERHYYPDFYLRDFNIFIEVKGYETEKDREKWKQFPFLLIIVKKNEINDLDIWFNTILVPKL
jgi:hypothetical protein